MDAILNPECALSADAKLVLSDLVRRGKPTPGDPTTVECYPSAETIARDTSLSVRTVERVLAGLQRATGLPITFTMVPRYRKDGAGGRKSSIKRLGLAVSVAGKGSPASPPVNRQPDGKLDPMRDQTRDTREGSREGLTANGAGVNRQEPGGLPVTVAEESTQRIFSEKEPTKIETRASARETGSSNSPETQRSDKSQERQELMRTYIGSKASIALARELGLDWQNELRAFRTKMSRPGLAGLFESLQEIDETFEAMLRKKGGKDAPPKDHTPALGLETNVVSSGAAPAPPIAREQS